MKKANRGTTKSPVAPATSLRDFCAHVLQLCDYVEDLRIEKKMTLTDFSVVRKKALAVRDLALRM